VGRPRADLASYSPWGAIAVPPPSPPSPNFLPVIPQAGLIAMGDLVIWAMQQPAVAPQCQLYINEYVPTASSTLASFTITTAGGLGAQSLGVPTNLGIDHWGRADWQWPTLTYTATGTGLPILVWGYVVSCTDPITGMPAILWAQRLPTGFGFVAPGDSLPLVLRLSLGQC